VIIWLFGDSIFHGAITDEPLGPEDELWPIRAPAQLINLMIGEEQARLAGGTNIPDGVPKAAAQIRAMVARQIQPEDTIVMLDVGPHAGDADVHERQWLELRRATGDHAGRTIICEGFDERAKGHEALWHCRPIGGGTRSANDAVKAAAQTPLDQAGRTVFLPTAKPLLRFHHYATTHFGLRAFRRDGVHLTAWGQARLCWLMVCAVGLGNELARARWREFAVGHWHALEAGSAEIAGSVADLACAPGGELFRDQGTGTVESTILERRNR
jgi:hypothetical protein